MAAGLSSRFGRNKLLEVFNGRSLIERALDAVPGGNLYRVVVVTRFPEIRAMAKSRKHECVWNDRPEDGISHTINLGLQRLDDADAALFMVCDQVYLTQAAVTAMVDYYRQCHDHIVCMSYGGERGNPCIFPSAFFPELLALEGDRGGSEVIRRHETRLKLFEASDASELMDIDHPGTMPGEMTGE